MGRVVVNGLTTEQAAALVVELRHRSDLGLGSATYELGGDATAADAVAFPARRVAPRTAAGRALAENHLDCIEDPPEARAFLRALAEIEAEAASLDSDELRKAVETLEARLGEGFPIQRGRNSTAPSTVPRWLAQKAYDVYSARYGTSQSLDRLGERGGFHEDEYDQFVPGWRALLSAGDKAEAPLDE